jgi:hypothetical protein
VDPIFEFVERKFKPHNSGVFDFHDGDLVSVPSKQLVGVGIDGTILCVDCTTMTSFRMNFRNVGTLRPEVYRLKSPFDLIAASQFFKANEDNPYAIIHFIQDLKLGVNPDNPTQYPPLNIRKDGAVQLNGVHRLTQASQACDVLFMTVRDSGVSHLIRNVDRCQFSHVGMIVRPGVLIDLTISGMNRSHVTQYGDPSFDLALYRPRFPMSDEGKAAVVERMERQLKWDVQYSWPTVLKTYLRKRWGWKIKIPPTPGDLLAGGQFQLVDYV